MDVETFSGIVWGVVLFGLLMLAYFASQRRRHRMRRLLILELLKRYFEGGISADQLAQRARHFANHRFMRSSDFYALAAAGFQRAVDAKRADVSYSDEEEKKLLILLGALKRKFGLTDRYQLEALRSGRQ